jgi:acyl carrier protein
MREASAEEVVPFEEFRRIIAEELQVEERAVVSEASFVADLLADSIQLVELMLRLEDMGVDMPMEAAWDVETVGDAYQLYTRHALQNAQARGKRAQETRTVSP